MPVLKVENLSKLYRLGEVGTGTISHDLNRWWARMRGKEDPYSLVGQTNDRSQKAESDYVWALKDINFEVEQGEILGIIGRNGAGKSTLLKILSQITSPTTGEIKTKGRIASLLEVGTGMHPEMTARENIYLNGAILGMTKKEIAAKFDEIIDFSGCTMYVDTPLKRFSSGMRVRLGFAVAAFLEPEILIVDEVLAVGDAEFQKKAIGKMKDISSGAGRTVLFVSHNMTAVKNLCSRSLLLDNGSLKLNGPTSEIIQAYLSKSNNKNSAEIHSTSDCGTIVIESLQLFNEDVDGKVMINKPTSFRLNIRVLKETNNEFNFNLFFTDGGDNVLFVFSSDPQPLDAGCFQIEYLIPANFFNDIHYNVDVMAVENKSKGIVSKQNVLYFKADEPNREGSWFGSYPGVIRPKFVKPQITKIH
jgi:lipopolysaccharide transport system ATP-binding protein